MAFLNVYVFAAIFTGLLADGSSAAQKDQRVNADGSVQIQVQACPYDEGEFLECWGGRYSDATRGRLQDAKPYDQPKRWSASYFVIADYPGRYALQFFYAAAKSSPVELSVNGSTVGLVMRETTGGLGWSKQQYSSEIEVKLKRGLNEINLSPGDENTFPPLVLSFKLVSKFEVEGKVEPVEEIPVYMLVGSANVKGDTIGPKFGPRGAPIMRSVSDNVPRSFAAYDFDSKASGRYWLLIQHASTDIRRIAVTINGEYAQPDVTQVNDGRPEPEADFLRGATGGWEVKDLQWDRPALQKLVKGKNRIELSRNGPFPFIGSIRFIKED
jgi:hypothetical protein